MGTITQNGDLYRWVPHILFHILNCSIYTVGDDDSSEISGPHRPALADLESLDGSLLRQILAYLRSKQQRSVEEKYGDLNKRNYNLDHLARMNFRRSYRTGQLSTRHILGGL